MYFDPKTPRIDRIGALTGSQLFHLARDLFNFGHHYAEALETQVRYPGKKYMVPGSYFGSSIVSSGSCSITQVFAVRDINRKNFADRKKENHVGVSLQAYDALLRSV